MRGTGYTPTPDEIREWRGMIPQVECAKMIYIRQSVWSYYETGKVRMHPAMWELFLIKVRHHELFREP